MELFEKYLCKETNPLVSVYFKFKLRLNSTFKEDYEQYLLMSNNLKYMFILDKAEKEIKDDKKFLRLDRIISNCLMKQNLEIDVQNYIGKVYTK